MSDEYGYASQLNSKRDRNPPTTSPRAKQNRSSGACSSNGGALIATATSTPFSVVPRRNQGPERKTQQRSRHDSRDGWKQPK
eukprot:jgi/Psemu1/60679/gm1.60679_g